ncbi:McrB family protein [Sphingobacterium spiritivorum]|uniref:McrB family protein n=1 Tax=Sphingobacterium spiritivorum TaxID=258 RepID=UPI003DA49AB8
MKRILINENFYNLDLAVENNPLKREAVTLSRKVHNGDRGNDKNNIYIRNIGVLIKYFGHDFSLNQVETLDVYFSIENLISSYTKTINKLKIEYPSEIFISLNDYVKDLVNISKINNIYTSFVKESCKISKSNNGVALKNWSGGNFFNKFIKVNFFLDSSLQVYFFKDKSDKTCAYYHLEVREPSTLNLIKDVFDNNKFINILKKSHLEFNDKLIKRFVASLITKPFVILTGLAGSGKTKLAQSFIQWICESDEQYKIVPVGADWINREPLLGYPNGLKENEYVTPDNGVLQLMFEAAKDENQDKPYFLVLDEMNLSHVERYFADFLSIMESDDSIKLYTGSERESTEGQDIPRFISWPKNLFIIGTVNIDETTYMFSPKVLDRANVIEFRLEENELRSFLAKPLKVDLSQLIGQGAAMSSSFLSLAQATDTATDEELNKTLIQFFNELKAIGAEFGYRSAFEIHLLFAQFEKIDKNLSLRDKVDFAVMQKLLPKLHGSRSKIVKTLEALMKLCLEDISDFNIAKLDEIQPENIKYKISFDKIKRMYFNALNNGFTSYAEA